jgi:hypothetical protein
MIAPLEVFEHEEQRLRRGQHLDRLRELTEHSLPSRTLHPPPHSLELRIRDQGGHLDEPRGRVTGEDRPHLRALRQTAEAPERLEERQIGLAGSEVLDALAAGRSDAAAVERPHEGVDERRLADARLAGDEHDAPGPRLRLREPALELLQLRLAADEARRRELDVSRGLGEAGAAVAVASDRRDEAVPAPRDRLDEARGGRVVPEERPQLADVAAQQALAHVRVRPHGLRQLRARHEPRRVRREVRQHRERLPAKRQALRAPPELLVGEVQSKRRKLDESVGVHERRPPGQV